MPRLLSISLLFNFLIVGISASVSSSDVHLTRNLLKSGFHRDLESIIVLPHSIRERCVSFILMMLETLPAGIYADPFQVKTAEHFGGPQVTFDRQVDIEAAAFLSRAHRLKMFINLNSDLLDSPKNNVFTVKINLPIHVRYHQPSIDASIDDASVIISNPKLYMNCLTSDDVENNSLSELYNGTSYTWYQINYKSVSSRVVLKIPVGQEKDKPFVLVITLLVTVAVSAVLYKSIAGCPYIEHCKMS